MKPASSALAIVTVWTIAEGIRGSGVIKAHKLDKRVGGRQGQQQGIINVGGEETRLSGEPLLKTYVSSSIMAVRKRLRERFEFFAFAAISTPVREFFIEIYAVYQRIGILCP